MAQTPSTNVGQTAAVMTAPTHTVQRGDTLYSIARRYNTGVGVIRQLNNLTDNNLKLGQILRLPVLTVQHTVQRGDTLFSIAKRYASSVEAIRQENKLQSAGLSLGQILRIPQSVSVGASVRPTNPQPLPDTPQPTPQPQPSSQPAPTPNPANTDPPLGSDTKLVNPVALPNSNIPANAQAIPQPKLEDASSTQAQSSNTVQRPTSTPTTNASGQTTQPTQSQPAQSQNATQPTQSQPAQSQNATQPTQSQPAQSQNATQPTQSQPAQSQNATQPRSITPADTDYNPNHPLIPIVLRYLGLPYVYGANSDRAVDCSAFVQQVFGEAGVRVPRTSREQFATFPNVVGAMRQGDLVFFSFGGSQIDHVGIYLGRGVFAHANSYGSRVVIESLDSPYYKKVFRGAKRVEIPLAGN